MSGVVLKSIIAKGNKVSYDYEYPLSWNDYFVKNEGNLFFEYDFNVESVPKSLLAVPFVANMLTVAMFENTVIEVEELDKSFYECIPNVVNGFKKIYPRIDFAYQIVAKKLVDNSYEITENKLLAFTGGLDATSAFATVDKNNLTLVNIWGADVKLNMIDRHNYQMKYFLDFSKKYDCDFKLIKSNLRFIFNGSKIPYTKYFSTDWWCAVSHTVAIITAFTPLIYALKAKSVYLGSTYKDDLEFHDDANNVLIVNQIKIANCQDIRVVDDDLKRIDKIENISKKLNVSEKNPINVFACWNHDNVIEGNCCDCEKCFRTIMEIKSQKLNPIDFGFNVDENTYLKIKDYIKTHKVGVSFWKEIQNEYLSDKNFWKKDKNLKWILTIQFNKQKTSFFKKILRPFVLVKRKFQAEIKKIKNKNER